MKAFLLSFAFLCIIMSPTLVGAADPIVPCDGVNKECQACSFVQLGQNLLEWFIGIMASVIAVVFAWAGMKMVTAGGSSEGISEAKSMMTNAVVGFVILLSAWLIINTFMSLLVGDTNLGRPWHTIQCVDKVTRIAPPSTPGSVTTAPSSAGCPTCANLPSSTIIPTNGNACAAGYACQMRPEITSRLTSFDLNKEGLAVSEAWPPTGYSASKPNGIHSSSCHGNATCIDVSYADRNKVPTGQEVASDITAFKSNNLKAVYEVQTEARRAELVKNGASNVIVVPTINREHYSVYACDLDSSANACKS